MYDWQKMASVVARKLVENGQTRILKRIHEGVTSNWVLDVADDKSSINHQLIHLVWRKFPRNQHSTEERRPTTVSTQTDGQKDQDSSAVLGLGLDTSADLSRPVGNLFDSKINTSSSDAGSYSDCLSPGLAESELFSFDNSPQSTSFIPTSKRRSSKPLFTENNFYPELSNRFGCLEEVSPPENFNVNAELNRNSRIVPQGNRPRSPPNKEIKSKKLEIPKTLPKKFCESLPTSAIPTTSTQEDDSSKFSSCPPQYKIGTVISSRTVSIQMQEKYAFGEYKYTGTIETVDHGSIIYWSKKEFNPGSQVTYLYGLNGETGKHGAYRLSPYQDAFSPGHLL